MRRRGTPSLLAALAALTATAFLAPPAGAVSASWAAVAAADGVRIGVFISNFVAVTGDQVVDVGAPAAQALVDSTGDSQAFAAHPYPGAVVAPNPAYPFIASASWPTVPEKTVDHGAYRLTARSEEESSNATATTGVAGGDDSLGLTRAAARAVRDPESGTMTAQSETTVDALAFGSTLRISRVHSEAQVVTTADGVSRRRASMEIGRMAIAGQEVALTPKGLVLPGSTTPLPQDHPLLEELRRNGISVRYLTAQENPDGVVGPGVEVAVTNELPVFGTAVITFTIGRASSHARSRTFGEVLPGVPVAPAAPSEPSLTEPLPAPAAPAEVLGGQTRAPATQAAPPSRPLALGRRAPEGSAKSAYLVLVLAGAAALAGGQLVRWLGIRLAWKARKGE